MAKKKISELPDGVAVLDADLLPVVQGGVTRKVTRGDLVPVSAAPDSDDVTYAPGTLANWNGSADPGDVEQALDQLAARAKTLETTVPTHVHDSDDITYAPTVLADWNGSADPGDVEQALDQLAERVKDTEGVISGAIGDGDKGHIIVSSGGTVWTIDSAVVTEAMQTLADNTTANVSTSAHGYAPKVTAPSSGIRNILAIDNGETTLKNTALFDTTNPADLGTAGPGTSLIAARRDHIHNSPGGGGGGGLTLVENKIITTGVTDVTFSGLDGNTDRYYLLLYKIFLGAAGNLASLLVKPNGLNTNLTSYKRRENSGGAATGNTGDWPLSLDPISAGGFLSGEVIIHAACSVNGVAQQRTAIARLVGSANTIEMGSFVGKWNETSTNLTSIQIDSGASAAIGNGSQLTLYKYAQ